MPAGRGGLGRVFFHIVREGGERVERERGEREVWQCKFEPLKKVTRVTRVNHYILVCDGLHVTRVSRVNHLILVCDGLHVTRVTRVNQYILVCDGLHVTRVSRVNHLIVVCDGMHLIINTDGR
jgi:hypothetical protein